MATQELIERLEDKAKFLRWRSVEMNIRTAHPGGALSSADIFTVLYYHTLRVDPENPSWPDRDVLINSRGFACEPLYVALADLGFFPESDLAMAEEMGSHMHGMSATTTPGVEFSGGSLGHGLGFGVGVALGKRARGLDGRVMVLTGDGEIQEGANWEAAMAAGHYKLENFVWIVDRNRYQTSARGTEDTMSLEPLHTKMEAFGFAARRINGHDIGELVDTLEALPLESNRPSAVICDTVKGKGVSFFEENRTHAGRFGRNLDTALQDAAIKEVRGY